MPLSLLRVDMALAGLGLSSEEKMEKAEEVVWRTSEMELEATRVASLGR